MPEFKQLSHMVEYFKAEGVYILCGSGASVKESNEIPIIYGEYVWLPLQAAWVRIGTRTSAPTGAIEWLEFKDGFTVVTVLATKQVTRIRSDSFLDCKKSPAPEDRSPPIRAPFKPGDVCVAEGIDIPQPIEFPLEYRSGTWWYGNIDVLGSKFELIEEADLERMCQAVLLESNRSSRWTADRMALIKAMLAKKGKCLSMAGTLTVEIEE